MIEGRKPKMVCQRHVGRDLALEDTVGLFVRFPSVSIVNITAFRILFGVE
jgi:hypothetical protein